MRSDSYCRRHAVKTKNDRRLDMKKNNREMIENVSREVVYAQEPPFPRNVLMEVSNACNHSCAFCGNRNQDRVPQNAEKTVFFPLMDRAYELGAREIGFYLNGEPFLNKELPEYIYHAAHLDNGKSYEYIYLTTNGALATPQKVGESIKNGLSSIKFSVNAATRETYKKVHGKDDFEQVVENIRDLNRMKEDGILDIPVFLSFIKNKYNVGEVELLHEIFDSLVDKIYVYEMSSLGGFNPSMSELMLESSESKVSRPCHMLFNRIHITSQGYLDACCIDFDNSTVVEDLKGVDLKDAWYGERMIHLRREQLEGTVSKSRCYYCVNGIRKTDYEPLNKELYEGIRK